MNKKTKAKIKRTKTVLICILLLIIGAVCYALIPRAHKASPPKGAIHVDVARVIQKDMPYTIELAGAAEAYQSVEVKPLVTGQIIKVHFEDGQVIKENDLLFEIDPRSFKYQLEQAEANLLRDQSQLENAEKEEKRYRYLFEQKAVSEEQYLQMLTNLNSLKASVQADKALIASSSLQLEYTKILAPIEGRVGEALFGEGNLAEADSSQTLAIINRISPINIGFSVPAQYLGSIKQSKETKDLTLVIQDSSGRKFSDGEIVFIDNAVDATSSTIKLKALFPNLDEAIWPGQFVKVFLGVYKRKNALIIPVKAVQVNQNGHYVFVVDQNNKTQIRNITIDFSDDNYAVIAKGLEAGEMVVINGQLYLSQDMIVVPNLVSGA